MSKKPPNRPGITFEVGARVEAQDYLQKWYPSHIEKIDYDEGTMLVHFDRWSHRYDEWILWDSNRIRPLERPALRKEGLKEEEELRDGEEVLARWTDCRYYPAKIESINKEGTYTVQFYDGVIRCVKRIHIKSMPEDAKGQQDWIALVMAASGAAKNKGGNRPRTSANSNKDRVDRREQRSDEELDDDDEDDDDSESEKLGMVILFSPLCKGYSDLDEMSLAYLDRPSSPIHRSSSSAFKHSTFQYPRAILSVDLTGENLSDIDFLEDSTTESLLFSGDEYYQDLDSITMEDFQDEDDDGADEIVRCICEMDEENGFMIQCEECMCWQHSVCMGLLEDSIPDHYICYICRDPPGQRWSAKYRHDKDWLQKGHMYGLSFLTENYSHHNAKKIVSTHQLLADVYSVKNLLHGLQLKMDILQNKHNPSLHLWARSWVNSDEDQPMGGVPDCLHFKEHLNLNSNPETYITSEHSYQKPPGTGLEHTRDEQGMQTASQFNRKEEEGQYVKGYGVSSAIALSGCVNDSGLGSMEQARNCLQWQMNLLTHIEDVQNQLSGRMDLIEKELDVLESWLDFTGELEPPDPLARLPQVKCRIRQLLTDLGKVQQMSTLCSV
uniref:PHD finger protein 20-like protein 1 n=1 Tax=Sinocyclocheilus anshuiensis TaxID=1608454 RepID=A0A671M4F8_9TELE